MFKQYIQSIVNAKMLEVCSTSLPQYSIPKVIGDSRYLGHLAHRKKMFEVRVDEAYDILAQTTALKIIKPKGAFYMAVLFQEGILNSTQKLEINDQGVREYIEEKVKGVEVDKRFVYYLLGATGICVVPLTGFCCTRKGFRITLLETDDEKRRWTWKTIVKAVEEYVHS
jgi:aspartate/methionine/tyrosine aminotransferase